MLVETRPREQEASDELEALIEEARRRARRRRIGYLALAAGVALAAGIYLLLGGGGGGARSGGSPSNQPGAASAPGSNADSISTGYRCPTTIAALRRSRPGSGIPGCMVHFAATLPPGWHDGPTYLSVFPPAAFTSGLGGVVRFTSFPLRSGFGHWPISHMPSNGIAIGIFAQAPASKANSASPPVASVRPADFRRVPVAHSEPVASTRLYTGGWRFQVQVRVGSGGARSDLVDEANAVLASIETTQHLCPCVRKENGGGSRFSPA
jgi:hypothetical protein